MTHCVITCRQQSSWSPDADSQLQCSGPAGGWRDGHGPASDEPAPTTFAGGALPSPLIPARRAPQDNVRQLCVGGWYSRCRSWHCDFRRTAACAAQLRPLDTASAAPVPVRPVLPLGRHFSQRVGRKGNGFDAP